MLRQNKDGGKATLTFIGAPGEQDRPHGFRKIHAKSRLLMERSVLTTSVARSAASLRKCPRRRLANSLPNLATIKKAARTRASTARKMLMAGPRTVFLRTVTYDAFL